MAGEAQVGEVGVLERTGGVGGRIGEDGGWTLGTGHLRQVADMQGSGPG